jgi:hypothetical protein
MLLGPDPLRNFSVPQLCLSDVTGVAPCWVDTARECALRCVVQIFLSISALRRIVRLCAASARLALSSKVAVFLELIALLQLAASIVEVVLRYSPDVSGSVDWIGHPFQLGRYQLRLISKSESIQLGREQKAMKQASCT